MAKIQIKTNKQKSTSDDVSIVNKSTKKDGS